MSIELDRLRGEWIHDPNGACMDATAHIEKIEKAAVKVLNAAECGYCAGRDPYCVCGVAALKEILR